MSTKITLESRQRLPRSSEMLNSCSKQFCAAEQSIGTTSTSLNKMDSLLDAMQQQCYEVENRIGVVSDVLEIMQTIERNKYFTEEGLRPTCESDVDSTA
ncbi:hypothetical protein RB195_021702 [Necator americanus]|uniref:BLOC-1-related complex subunit 7 n=1 Tax=Necator americanus TaxID=51031 RepID=A0ABR1ECA8_NECAM